MRDSINLRDFHVIEDIIFMDEPILSHLKYGDNNYLLYLIDVTDEYNEYILFDVDEEDLLKYLTKRLSLRSLIYKHSLVNIIEERFDDESTISYGIMVNQLSEKYLPTEDSFIEYKPTSNSEYNKLIDDFNKRAYKEDLKKNAFYLKFGTSHDNNKYGDTITLDDLTNVFLKNLNSSYKNFVEIDFEKSFSNKISDDKERRKLYNEASKYANLRAVDFKEGSFEIGLAYDSLMTHKIEHPDVKEWSNNVAEKFGAIVLDENIDDSELDNIMKEYNDDEREKIFKPIVKIIDNQNFDIKIRKSGQANYKHIGLNKKSVSNKILSKEIANIKDILPDFQLIQVTTVIDKNNPNKKLSLNDGLFSELENTSLLISYADFVKYGYDNIDENIKISIDIENKHDKITYKTLYKGEDIIYESKENKIDEGLKKIIQKVYEYSLQ
ncbi:TPA: hypothetical protein JRX02_002324 [Elizabethkingia anophelis]|uniref:hypothetical protein n=1 Tax=Elizabethkingia anophelis TaxID=1117645 RepID=UPI00296B871E|nr:hypothetical protein [Elizabethkingia anophelis]HAY3503878.1 hypothetical protein [Elizabethkingia anophelis]HAY3511856.1 hypothetical protein [Elizabethkingia anophelis]HAY3515941.1 hypothetical protein [Elizabethkingia anophelis]HAY3519807.1 hypothetical protein [Elizabethkingia anophelis]